MKKLLSLLFIVAIACVPASTCAASATTPVPAQVTDALVFRGSVQLVLYTGSWAEVLPIKVVDAGWWVSVPMSCDSSYCRGEIRIAPGDHQLVVLNHDGWVIWTTILGVYRSRTVKSVQLPGIRSYEIGSVVPTCQLGCYNAGIARGRLFCVPTDFRNPPAGGCRLGGGGGGSQWWIP